MKKILFNGKYKGKYTLVDDEDYKFLNRRKWQINSSGYVSKNERGKILFMHHLLMPARDGMEVDHINRDKLDNRKENLRYLTKQQQSWNTSPQKVSTSKYKGVSYNPNNKYSKWTAKICIKGKRKTIGSYITEEIAAASYNQMAKKHFGEYAYINDVPYNIKVPTREERIQRRNKIVATERDYQPKGGNLRKRRRK